MADITRLPGAQLHHWEWQRDAACRGMDSTLFFHPPNERDTARSDRADRAKAICRSCPVITECLDHALRVRESYGVWRGHTEPEPMTATPHLGWTPPTRSVQPGPAWT